jgi:hypothetical protein
MIMAHCLFQVTFRPLLGFPNVFVTQRKMFHNRK